MAATKCQVSTNQVGVSATASRLLEKQFVSRALAASRIICAGTLRRQDSDPETLAAQYAQSRLLTMRLLVLLFADCRQLLPDESSEALRRLLVDDSNDLAELATCIQLLRSKTESADTAGIFDDLLPTMTCTPGVLREAIRTITGVPVGQQPINLSRLRVLLIGRCYESLLDVSPEWSDGELVFPMAPHGRKASGKFFTPPSLVDYIVRNTLEPAAQEMMFGANPDEAPQRLLGLNVLDPSCGCGDFLVAAARFIGQTIAFRTDSSPDQWVRQAAEKCVYGVDSDPIAVAIAEAALWLDAGIPGEPYWRPRSVRCGNSLMGACLHDILNPPNPRRRQTGPRRAQANLFQGHILSRTERLAGLAGEMLDGRVALTPLRKISDVWMSSYLLNSVNAMEYLDAMLDDDDDWFVSSDTAVRAAELAEDNRFFHWDTEFPEVFFDERGIRPDPGFDAVIGNPPYVAAKNEDMDDYLRIHGGAGQSDYYLLFLSNVVNRRLVRRGGYLSMVLPDPFLVRGNAADMRRTLLTDWTMTSVLHIKGMFPGAGVSNAVPVCRNLRAADYDIAVRRVDTAAGIARFVEGGYADYHEYHSLSSRFALSRPDCELAYLAGQYSADRCSRLTGAKYFLPLGQMCVKIFRGEEIGKRAITSNVGELPILLGGQSVRPFAILWEGRRVGHAAVKKPMERYLCEKIVLQKSSGKIIAALDSPTDHHPGYVLPQSVYSICSLPDGPNPYYLLALLNSEVLKDYAYRMFTGYKLIQPQIEIEDLKRLPIPIINFTIARETREKMVSDACECPEDAVTAVSEWLKSGKEDAAHDLIVRFSQEISNRAGQGQSIDDLRALLNQIVRLLYGLPATQAAPNPVNPVK